MYSTLPPPMIQQPAAVAKTVAMAMAGMYVRTPPSLSQPASACLSALTVLAPSIQVSISLSTNTTRPRRYSARLYRSIQTPQNAHMNPKSPAYLPSMTPTPLCLQPPPRPSRGRRAVQAVTVTVPTKVPTAISMMSYRPAGAWRDKGVRGWVDVGG